MIMITKPFIAGLTLLAGVVIAATAPTRAQDSKGPDVPINLQSTTPGSPQIGHGNITGTFKAGYLKGVGLGITGINANNIAVGTLASERLPSSVARTDVSNVFNGYLTVKGYSMQVRNTWDKQVVYIGGDDAGKIQTVGSTGNRLALVSSVADHPSLGYINVFDSAGTNQAGMYVDTDGKGRLYADVKNFKVPNPRNDAEDIVYACVEGPEAAAYVRGTGHIVNGMAHVTLPQHFQDVSVAEGMTVQITPSSLDSKGLAVFKKSLAGFDVGELNGGKGSYDFDWEVKCVRAGHEDYKPVEKWDAALPGSIDKGQLWNARVTSIAAQRARSGKPARP
jgi:hypothetical protein